MEATERLSIPALRVGASVDLRALGAWLLPFLTILYLGLNNGGYDVIERSEVGIVVWWVLLTGTVAGALTLSAGTRAGRLLVVLLLGFAAWTALSLVWTESSERTVIEFGRVLTYAGIFVLALSLQGDGRWRYTLQGVTAGVVFICAIALLSRLEPSWFPAQVTGRFFSGLGIESRLAYPLNYPSGLGALAAIALPLLLAATSASRTVATQALAAAGIPVCALTLWLSASGLSVPVAIVAMVVFLVLSTDRLPKVASLLAAAAGSAILFAAVVQRPALDHGFTGEIAQRQGDELLTIVLAVCAGVGLIQAGLGLATRYGSRPNWLRVSREQARAGLAVAGVATLIAVGVAGTSGGISHGWSHFKSDTSVNPATASRASSILDYSSNGRYDFWRSAVRANEAHPWIGTGAGTFQYWWTRDRHMDLFVRNSHSLYFDALAELGIIGFLLIGCFSLAVLGAGGVRCLRTPPSSRTGLAAAMAGCVGFVLAAAIDWMWQLAVLTVIFLCLAAVVAGADEVTSRPAAAASRRGHWIGQVAIAGVCLVALATNVIPLASSEALHQSQSDAKGGRLQSALTEARDASALQPYAATPFLQEALVLEEMGKLDRASAAIRTATQEEPTNWSTWLVRSRIEARSGKIGPAIDAYKRAKLLNPRSILFRQ